MLCYVQFLLSVFLQIFSFIVNPPPSVLFKSYLMQQKPVESPV